jgi:outer membrane immunogenic protein
MRRFALVGAGLFSIAGFVGAASAADLPVRYAKAAPPAISIYDWSGFYIGLNAGGAVSQNCWNTTNASGNPLIGSPSNGCHEATGALAGGQVGYRWQATNWVFGLEAQGDWANLKGSNTSEFGAFGGFPFSNRTKIDAIGLFTGQVGYAWNNVLGYVKGGAALTDDKYNGVSQVAVGAFPAGFAFDQASGTRWGSALGIGLEYGFAPGWSVGIEYDHLFMGRSNANIFTPGGVFDRTARVEQDLNLGTARLSYHFGSPVVANY